MNTELKQFFTKDVLPALGMRRRNNMLPIMSALGAGIAIGVGIKYLMDSEGARRVYERAEGKIRETLKNVSSKSETSERPGTQAVS